jgi:2-methylcitrate synthase
MSAPRGATVGKTAISHLGDHGADSLTYRGYAIEDLAAHSNFEEVAYLITRGRLPTAPELVAYRARLRDRRTPPPELVDLLTRIPDSGDPLAGMDALRTACSFLGSIEPEHHAAAPHDAADRLIALLPGLMVGWHRRGELTSLATRLGDTGASSTAGQILTLLDDQPPAEDRRRALDVSLVLYADLAFNASTFACRVCAATWSDLHSCVTTGIGTLRGPLHGGASVEVIALLDTFPTPAAAHEGTRDRLARKQKVPGFGHAIFQRDPRSPILHQVARDLAAATGQQRLVETAEAVAAAMSAEKHLEPNVDFYTACCYRLLNIPMRLFSPLFVCARVAGWAAHVAEQRGQKGIIHPVADYVGPPTQPYVPLDERPPAPRDNPPDHPVVALMRPQPGKTRI